ncbi:ABC transporter ATP-binding protein [Natronoglycomyces albus]|uniref:ABC transporter ATP-binding protein n=1 Tax=Natronoglycomyces albus TaxID=2811108 RepID=A0A895XVJ0_9ACTN|nr:ABC transporter ATP-binding protein [Natronoglycomyces albus]QSB06240.1 ABC transporter ATP-binding protein [Natronoglycomyces albus]
MTETVLQLRGVSRVHGTGDAATAALVDLDLDIHPGELVAVMGPSGSGKSTLLNLAGGLDSPTSGEVLVEGQNLQALSRRRLSALRRHSIGYVFQDFNLIDSLTLGENASLPLELDGTSVRKSRKAALQALEEVNIGDLVDRFPNQVSGGQQQRCAIARAFVGRRRLILADEPTGALDSVAGEEVLKLLRSRCDQGAAGLMVTHDARHAGWADRIVFLRDGSQVDSSAPLVARA